MQQSHKNPGDNPGDLCNTQQFHNNPGYMQLSINRPVTPEVSTVLHNVISGSISMWLQYNLMNVRIHKSVVYERDVKTHRGILTLYHDASPCIKHTMHVFFTGIVY